MIRPATMLRRGKLRPRFPADRYVAVAVRLPVYRQIGRRPSQVYVDDAMRPAAAGVPERRLFDNVFQRCHAEIGDQIEDRAGGLLLVTVAVDCHPIQLSPPRALEVATAFGQADKVLREDRKILDTLLAEGSVVEASPRRSNAPLTRLPDTLFDEDHPLVVANWPAGEAQPAPLIAAEPGAARNGLGTEPP